MLLSILIPTYNRSPFLLKNMGMLVNHIQILQREAEVEIVVSNNCSTDSTDADVRQFVSENSSVAIRYFRQEKNIGLEKNALFVLQQSSGTYAMYLGDDDFIEVDFLGDVLKYISDDEKKIVLVIPNNYAVDVDGNQISQPRDRGYSTNIYVAGFTTCLEHSWRGHQLSGLVVKKSLVLPKYLNNKVQNIYPFIYFTTISCMSGSVLHLTDPAIKVTMPGQHNKDWNYGEDGLLNEIFDNYKKAGLNSWQCARLQMKVIQAQPFRLWKYRKQGRDFLKAVRKVWFAPNACLLFRFTFPFLLSYMLLRIEAYPKVKQLFPGSR